ncbi:hypothetical protein [Aquimarina sp. RZ0]|uniref:hypothetical protein n=1 Tax=Aquimarina sp. RZ0 TaxID=2607730 RepID=UPI0011F29DC0|nr:hypothetical protein [Aquimarina sp. RZ0]KAA1247060.1 hypothetical protein F0000_05075 [Aquimarina sp. RZ0]
MFLFFLIFTSLLWLFIQFSKNYTQEVEIEIRYINLPENRILNDSSDQTLKLILNGNGFRMMTHSWSKPRLQFDIANADSFEDNNYYFSIDIKDQSLRDKLDFEGRVLSAQKNTLRAKLDVTLKKKIPVRLIKEIGYVPGYGSDRGVLLLPDSITIHGPEKIVDTIHYIYTENLKLEDLNTDYSTSLSIKTNGLPEDVYITPKEIEASIVVSKFTEGSQEVPISLINVPEGKEIKIFPKDVIVVYRVGLDKYNEINVRDFKVVADYDNIAEDSSFLILKLVDIPASIHDVRLQDKQVQFVILK